MATSDQNKELIEDIKRPVKHYKIRIAGYGMEGVWGESSKEELEFWNDKEARCEQMELDPDEHDNPFEVYMFEKEDLDEDGFPFIPKHLRREGAWYEQDNIEHASGAEFSAAFIEIVEVENDEYIAKEIRTICEGREISELCDEYDIENMWSDVDVSPYYFQAISSEKGQFFDGRISLNERIDLSKIKFNITECPTGDDIIVGVMYGAGDDPDNWIDIDNDGGNTNGKGMYVQLVEL